MGDTQTVRKYANGECWILYMPQMLITQPVQVNYLPVKCKTYNNFI